ncbi:MULTISPECIES: copper resistance protein CopC [Nocardiopsidaceae]|uniref:Methionine-rich copper-binding protein CopC n=1 Tax=Streptomonospora salina TaxID=104205 RepID=A0A841E9U8_9ACTN|nr:MULTISPECIES: copper resistance protein CopC [Nocardiopsaceae]MBB5999234.1 methionine-rich copper-binding protein CopC [Streptomonospora salina]
MTLDMPAALRTPPQQRLPARMRRPAVAAAALLGSLALATATAPPALAHDTLLGSTPEDGDELDTAPGKVELTFSDDIGDGGNAIVVTGPDGADYEEGEVEIEGPDASVGLRDLPAAGEYTVAYRIVSSDGHALEDELAFSVTDEAVAGTGSSPEAQESAPQDGDGADGSGDGADADESPPARSPTDPSVLGPVGGVVAGIAVIALIAILLIRMRNRPGGTDD